MKKVIIIGSGIGGLSTAIRLKAKGFDVDVFEKNSFPGGKLSNINIPIVDVRRSSEWVQTGVIPNSVLLTFFDKDGNYNFDKWYEKLQLEINEGDPIILICRSGKRSKIIAQIMNENFDHVIYNAKRGIISWIDEKLITVEPQIN